MPSIDPHATIAVSALQAGEVVDIVLRASFFLIPTSRGTWEVLGPTFKTNINGERMTRLQGFRSGRPSRRTGGHGSQRIRGQVLVNDTSTFTVTIAFQPQRHIDTTAVVGYWTLQRMAVERYFSNEGERFRKPYYIPVVIDVFNS